MRMGPIRVHHAASAFFTRTIEATFAPAWLEVRFVDGLRFDSVINIRGVDSMI